MILFDSSADKCADFRSWGRAIPKISQKGRPAAVSDGEGRIVHRTVYLEVPSKVHFWLTAWEAALSPGSYTTLNWAAQYENLRDGEHAG